MSAYCHAGVTCSSGKDDLHHTFCVHKHRELKIDPCLELPCGLMMTIDPERPGYAIPFTGQEGEEICAILADDVNTMKHTCAQTHAIAGKGEFVFESLLWPEGMDYATKQAHMNKMFDKGMCVDHYAC